MTTNTPATESPILSLLETAAIIERRLDSALAHTRGISFSEYRILRALAEAPNGSAARVSLADAVGLTPSAVTRALKPLEKLGYVQTTRNERDARQSLAGLTSAGKHLLRDANGVLRDALLDSPLNELSPTKIGEFQQRLQELRGN